MKWKLVFIPVLSKCTQHRLKICKTSIVALSMNDIFIPFWLVMWMICQLAALLQVTILQVIELQWEKNESRRKWNIIWKFLKMVPKKESRKSHRNNNIHIISSMWVGWDSFMLSRARLLAVLTSKNQWGWPIALGFMLLAFCYPRNTCILKSRSCILPINKHAPNSIKDYQPVHARAFSSLQINLSDYIAGQTHPMYPFSGAHESLLEPFHPFSWLEYSQ